MLALQPFSKMYTKVSYSLYSKWCWWLTIHPVLFNPRLFHFEQKTMIWFMKKGKKNEAREKLQLQELKVQTSVHYQYRDRSCLLLIICFLGIINWFFTFGTHFTVPPGTLCWYGFYVDITKESRCNNEIKIGAYF